MRPINQLVHARTRVTPRYALMPLEGFPDSRLPSWPDARLRVLASPALGAGFVQMLIDVPAGKSGSFAADGGVETFLFVLSGTGRCDDHELTPGSYVLTPGAARITASSALRLLVLRKRYEPAAGIGMFAPMFGHESRVEKLPWADNPHSRLQTLILDELQYDLAMNIFTFDPGHGLPVVETHVMEHGLLFLEGKGLYYLGDTWMEVERDDFIWMGPYCPQSFYAAGPTPARYIYYKNVNREMTL
jgi:(S)-ureidoglycine aminohydrolase